MVELDIHGAHEHARDELAKVVSVIVAVVGVVLAIVTIGSHRAHTAAVIHRTEANDQWAFYQAKKIREHLLDVGAALAGTLTAADEDKARDLVEHYGKERDRYDKEAKEIQRGAQSKEAESDHEERRALRLDLGEGFLELGLVLCSLYFLSKRKFFPVLGGVAAIIGAVVSATNWWV